MRHNITSGFLNRNELKGKKEDLCWTGKPCNTREEIERRGKETERKDSQHVEREGMQGTLYN